MTQIPTQTNGVPVAGGGGGAEPSKVLEAMLERLLAAIAGGPSLNARPHNSRQRIDLTTLEKLADLSPGDVLREILGDAGAARVVGRVKPPASAGDASKSRSGGRFTRVESTEEQIPANETPEAAKARGARRAFLDQQQLLTKVRLLVDEARTYEQDTGVYVLNIGFPLLSLPPTFAGSRGFTTRRVLAPLAFIPVAVEVSSGASPVIEISCKSDEVDRVVPNEAFLAWLEQQTGKPVPELFEDPEGSGTWREITEIVRHVAKVMEIEPPPIFVNETIPALVPLTPAPRADESGDKPQILLSAVIGLFPAANESLIRDTKEMLATGIPSGPVQRFVKSTPTQLAAPTSPATLPTGSPPPLPNAQPARPTREDRFVAPADPCQARAAAMCRNESGTVIHGPPGTGKSQTITNIISDHLSRGERVLFVCDKRTALDVVANRLQALGLRDLCAVVHDPQRDQKDLYMSIRTQLEGLSEMAAKKGLEARIDKVDDELDAIRNELTDFRASLIAPGPDGRTLQDLVGTWLALSDEAKTCPVSVSLTAAESAAIEPAAVNIAEALSRGIEAGYTNNPWKDAAGLTVAEFLAKPGETVRGRLDALVTAATAADALRRDDDIPFAGPAGAPSLSEQAAARTTLADALARIIADPDKSARTLWAAASHDAVVRAKQALEATSGAATLLRERPLDAELEAVTAGKPQQLLEVSQRLAAVEQYIPTAKSMLGFLAFGKKKAANEALHALGLALTPENAERARVYFSQQRAMLTMRHSLDSLKGKGPSAEPLNRDAILSEWDRVRLVVLTLADARTAPALAGTAQSLTAVLAGERDGAAMVESLKRSTPRAAALDALEQSASTAGLFSPAWLEQAFNQWRGVAPARPLADALRDRMPTIESILRIKETLATLGPGTVAAVRSMLSAGVEDEIGVAALRRAAAAAQASAFLESRPKLHAADGKRVSTLFARFRELEDQKRALVRDQILSRWAGLQQTRFLAATGSRLNSDAAAVKQRLVTRGSRALRLRQVLEMGRNTPGGDPLLDLRPVWMASPETVAQVFPRAPIFDVVIFDEASQCRLEEALPVLTRAKRVVIAGDPKQLPPTRFFESAAAASEEETIATDAELFEAQQSSVEDLLGAALNMDLAESYLDVHYRSQNAELIEFSNTHFYASRLQAIPGHPRNTSEAPALLLHRADGIYEDRTNEQEAIRIVALVKEMLASANPPSIGIACFNLSQRDLIVEALDEEAGEDPAFAKRLAAARARMGRGAPEGLFVKNLENVQGDERDVILISTTYGPDPSGKFYKRFGPLLQPGGGRRLNVLVTRARQAVHVITSIPRDAYATLPPVPTGTTPGGGWLLFAYLQYAESLQDKQGQPTAAAAPEPEPEVIICRTTTPCEVAPALAQRYTTERRAGSVVYLGNPGFCVDIALSPSSTTGPQSITAGVLIDFARYTQTADPIEWDIFRTGVLEKQGWAFERLWTPAIFRDVQGEIDRIAAAAVREARAR